LFTFTFTIIILSTPTTDPYPATLFLSVPTAQYHNTATNTHSSALRRDTKRVYGRIFCLRY